MAKKAEDKIRCRYQSQGAEWAITDAGHHRVLSCGDLLPGVRVCVRVTEKTVRQGYLRALTHGYGHHPMVFGLVELDPPKCKDNTIKVLTVTRHYRVEQISLLLA